MKQTQSINLGGYSFIIEVDALEKLEQYLAKVREHSASDVADELVSDIEERVAELFIERCGKGSVVDIASVEDAISRIGVPESDDSFEEDNKASSNPEPEANTTQKKERKRFYRSMNDRILGGVCSGIARYFGFDVLIIRLVLAGLLLLSTIAPFYLHLTGELILLYILLWVVLPAPKTVEQQCEAEGKPFSYDEFKEAASNVKQKAREGMDEMRRRAPEMKDNIRSAADEARTAPALRGFVRFIAIVVGVVLVLMGVSVLVTTAFTAFAIPTDFFTIQRLLHFNDQGFVLSSFASNPFVKWSCLASIALCGLGFLYGGIMLVFDIQSPRWRPGFVIFILWVIATLLFVLFTGKHAVEFYNIFQHV